MSYIVLSVASSILVTKLSGKMMKDKMTSKKLITCKPSTAGNQSKEKIISGMDNPPPYKDLEFTITV